MRSIIPAAVITSIGFLAQVIAFPLERQNLAKCDPGVEPPLWLPAPEAGLKKKDADPSFQAQDRENQVIEVRGVSNILAPRVEGGKGAAKGGASGCTVM